MKTFLFRIFAIAAITCVLVPVSLPAASTGNAQLIVKRSPNFGQNLDLAVLVDGKQVARVIFGHEYNGTLSPGDHTITVRVPTKRRTAAPVTKQIHAEPGKTYRLTAGFDGNDLILR